MLTLLMSLLSEVVPTLDTKIPKCISAYLAAGCNAIVGGSSCLERILLVQLAAKPRFQKAGSSFI